MSLKLPSTNTRVISGDAGAETKPSPTVVVPVGPAGQEKSVEPLKPVSFLKVSKIVGFH